MKKYHLNRDVLSRQALFKNLILALISKEEIVTTSAKARAVRSIFEKMVTKARLGSLHARRQIQSFIQGRVEVKKLFDEIAPRYLDVKGGYTRITMVGTRRGDNAMMVKLALTKKLASGKSEPDKVKKDVENKKVKSASSVPSAPVKEAVKAPKGPVAKSTGRIGFRQGER